MICRTVLSFVWRDWQWHLEDHRPMAFDLNKTYGQFAHIHLSNKGVVD